MRASSRKKTPPLVLPLSHNPGIAFVNLFDIARHGSQGEALASTRALNARRLGPSLRAVIVGSAGGIIICSTRCC